MGDNFAERCGGVGIEVALDEVEVGGQGAEEGEGCGIG